MESSTLTQEPKEKKVILVAHDIEKTGSYLIQNNIISVGFFVGDLEGNKLLTKKFNIRTRWPTRCTLTNEIINYGEFEKRCWDEFWSKQPKSVFDSCISPPPEYTIEVARGIKTFLDDLEEKYPEDSYKIKFLTDNASFDTASLDYLLEKHTERAPMRYSKSGKYRSVISADDMFDMLPSEIKKKAEEEMDKIVKHDHDPINDAHHIYLQYVAAMKYKPK